MKLIQLLLAIGLFGAITGAFAQTACPQGVGAGSAQCGPGGGTMSPGSSGPRQPATKWNSTWGAYAEDSNRAIFGSVIEQRSKRAAERAAVARCKEMGGGEECRVVMTYRNSCGVLVEPAEILPVMIGRYEGGDTVEEAIAKALPECVRANNGHACKVVHSACSQPYLVYD